MNDRGWSRLLDAAAARLRQAGVDSPRLDAELLLAHALRVARLDILTGSNDARRRATPAALRRFRALLARRARRVPLQYLTGTCEFYGRSFRVTPAVLVPRPETETLIDHALAWEKGRFPIRVLDLGTGSGAIALTVACERPGASVVATDASRRALAIARANARRLGVASRIRFLCGDLFAPLRNERSTRPPRRAPRDARRSTHDAPTRFDLILSNPPYIPTRELARCQPEVRDHEPRQATWGGPDGLSVIRRLVADAAAFLAPGGALMLEVGAGQARRVARLLQTNGRYAKVRVSNDLSGIGRVVSARIATPATGHGC